MIIDTIKLSDEPIIDCNFNELNYFQNTIQKFLLLILNLLIRKMRK